MYSNRAQLLGCLAEMSVMDIVHHTREMIGDSDHERKCMLAMNKYDGIMLLMSYKGPLCKHFVKLLEVRCRDLGFWFPVQFPDATVSPKLHELLVHTHSFVLSMLLKASAVV